MPFIILLFFLTPFACEAARDPLEVIFTENHKKGWYRDDTALDTVFPYIEMLADLIHSKKIQTVVEVGCGDWEFSKHIDWDGIDYIGFDIVKEIITKNNREFSAPNIVFAHANCLLHKLPPADLLICKDVLQHLSNNSIKQFLKQLHKYRYCLITNDIDLSSNWNNLPIEDGGYHPVDLKKPPFEMSVFPIFDFRSGKTHKQCYLIQNLSK